jgi:hypothetical protein
VDGSQDRTKKRESDAIKPAAPLKELQALWGQSNYWRFCQLFAENICYLKNNVMFI